MWNQLQCVVWWFWVISGRVRRAASSFSLLVLYADVLSATCPLPSLQREYPAVTKGYLRRFMLTI